MKKFVTACSVVAATATSALASLAPVQYTGPAFNTNNESTQGAGSFFVAPGLGSSAGFAIAMTGSTDSVLGSTNAVVGTGIGTTLPSILVSSAVVDNGGGNFDISVLMFTSDGTDLAPTGFNVGGIPATRLGFFMGVNGGGLPISLGGVMLANSASIELFNSAGSAGAFDISAFANIANPAGWDGSAGVNFGDGSGGVGVNAIEFLINVNVVPAPSGLAALAFGGLVATRRRR